MIKIFQSFNYKFIDMIPMIKDDSISEKEFLRALNESFSLNLDKRMYGLLQEINFPQMADKKEPQEASREAGQNGMFLAIIVSV